MRIWISALLLAATGWMAPAFAQVIPPADNHVVVSANVSRGTPAPQLDIWVGAFGGGDPGDPQKWAGNAWTCLSASDPSTGACSTHFAAQPSYCCESRIPLRFTEARSGISVILNVLAHSLNIWAQNPQCSGMHVYEKVIHNPHPQKCTIGGVNYQVFNYGKSIWAWVPPSELAKLPTGGVWKADLRLILNQTDYWTNTGWPLANFTAAISVHVTDEQSMQVFLPEFGTATPRIDLNLRTLPSIGGLRASGERTFDACLYDGYNAYSQRYTVKISDPESTGGDEVGRFFVRHPSPQGDPARNRVEYEVRSTTMGLGTTQYQSGQDRLFTGIPDLPRRPVRLPGVADPVFCTPWPFTLTTPEFLHADKQAGHYTGTLRVEFTASTTAP